MKTNVYKGELSWAVFAWAAFDWAAFAWAVLAWAVTLQLVSFVTQACAWQERDAAIPV